MDLSTADIALMTGQSRAKIRAVAQSLGLSPWVEELDALTSSSLGEREWWDADDVARIILSDQMNKE
jgi:hypothetical protein